MKIESSIHPETNNSNTCSGGGDSVQEDLLVAMKMPMFGGDAVLQDCYGDVIGYKRLSCDGWSANIFYSLGFIRGKRAERLRRKKGKTHAKGENQLPEGGRTEGDTAEAAAVREKVPDQQ